MDKSVAAVSACDVGGCNKLRGTIQRRKKRKKRERELVRMKTTPDADFGREWGSERNLTGGIHLSEYITVSSQLDHHSYYSAISGRTAQWWSIPNKLTDSSQWNSTTTTIEEECWWW